MCPRHERLRHNLEGIQAEIRQSFDASGREGPVPRLLAVTKYATGSETLALAEAMQSLGMPLLLGENRVQSLASKQAQLLTSELPIQWELIGTLQRNKAAQAIATASRIQSLDRPAILQRLEVLAAERDLRIRGLIQVHLSEEDTKHGFAPDEVEAALELAQGCPHLQIEGFMCMAARGSDHESARPLFAALRELRDRLAPGLRELSMGMSQDFKGAILEGSTLVRIGSALFAGASAEDS